MRILVRKGRVQAVQDLIEDDEQSFEPHLPYVWPQGPERTSRRLLEVMSELRTCAVLQHLDHQGEQLLSQTDVVVHHLKEEEGGRNPRSRLTTDTSGDISPVFCVGHLCNAGDEGVEAGGRAHLLRRDHEAALLLVVAQQHVQVALHRVEGFSAADVGLGAALVLGHELHEHHDELVDGLLVDAGVLGEDVPDDGVVLGGQGVA